MALNEMKKVNTAAPLSDGRMDASWHKQMKDNSSLLTWHACQGYQIVRGAKMGAEQKRRDCVKSSWEGKTRDRAEC